MMYSFNMKVFVVIQCFIKISILALVSCLFLNTNLYSQNFAFRSMTLEDGLPSSLITYVYQDSKGYIWFGSDNGLGRYDGFKVERFGAKQGVPLSFVTKIIEASNKNMWFSTFSKGVIVFDGKKWKVFDFDNGFPAKKVFDMIETSDGRMLFGTEKGVMVYDKGVFLNLTIKNLWPGRVVRAVYETKDKKLLFGTLSGLLIVNGDKYKFYTDNDGLIHNRVLSIKEDDENNIWIGTAEGLSLLKGEKWYSFSKNDVLNNDVVFCQEADSEDMMWFGTQKGIMNFDGKKWVSITEENGLISNYVYSLENDREGNLWVGTQTGVSILKNRAIFSFSSEHGLFGKTVFAVCVASDNKIWISCDKGLGYLKNNQWHIVKSIEGPSAGLVYGIVEDLKGNIWFAGDLGILKYDGKKLIDLTKFKSMPSVLFSNVYCDRKGVLWFGSRNKGLHAFNGKDWHFYDIYGELDDNKILSVYMDNKGTIWVGEGNGKINIFENGEWKKPNLLGMNIDVDITGFCEDSNGKFWIATYGNGIYCIEDSSLKQFSMVNGLIDDKCTFVREEKGYIVIGSQRGLSLFKDNKFFNYNALDGFTSSDLKLGACDADNGILWIGTASGLTKVNLAELKEKKVPPLVYITSVMVNGKEKVRQSGIELSYLDNNIDIQFTGLYFLGPDKITYRYMLEGVDNTFTTKSENSVSYRGLSPGVYKFRVRAGVGNNIWSEQEAEYEFILKPPIWKTTAFYVISQLILIILGILSFYYGRILVRIIKEYRKKRFYAHFQLISHIESGGEGDVYEAWDKKFKRKVALKILHKSIVQFNKTEKYMVEGLICEKLNHSGVVKVLERGQYGGRYYLSMEYVNGIQLQKLIENKRIPVTMALCIYRELLKILEEIHKNDIVHRDLKPENIMVVSEAPLNSIDQFSFDKLKEVKLKILDFGLAKYIDNEKLSRIESNRGTPMFLPPEYFLGKKEPSPSIDFYSAGVILYIMLTGEGPYIFQSEDIYQLISAILYDYPKPLCEINKEISSEISSFVLSLIDKDPDNRLIDLGIIKTKLNCLIDVES